jgi:hypothetical protein
MKWTVALAATVLISAANAQNFRVREPDARSGQPIAASPKRQVHKLRRAKHLLLFPAPAIRTVPRVALQGR